MNRDIESIEYRLARFGLSTKMLREMFSSELALDVVTWENRNGHLVFDNTIAVDVRSDNEFGDVLEVIKAVAELFSSVIKPEKIVIRAGTDHLAVGEGMQVHFEEENTHLVTINPTTFLDLVNFSDTLIHEIGHCLQKRLAAIANQEKLLICHDKQGETYPDLIAAYLLREEVLEGRLDEAPVIRGTWEALQKLLGNAKKLYIAKLEESIFLLKQRREHEWTQEGKLLHGTPAESWLKPPWLKPNYTPKYLSDRGLHFLLKEAEIV